MSAGPRLWTARYSNPNLASHPSAKVQTSISAPKFRLPYTLLHDLPELAPGGWMLHKPEAKFAIAYIKLLEQRGGIKLFTERFAEVARAAGVEQLTLMCYEDIREPGVWCHRRILAAWLEERTGQVVEELPDGPEQLEL